MLNVAWNRAKNQQRLLVPGEEMKVSLEAYPVQCIYPLSLFSVEMDQPILRHKMSATGLVFIGHFPFPILRPCFSHCFTDLILLGLLHKKSKCLDCFHLTQAPLHIKNWTTFAQSSDNWLLNIWLQRCIHNWLLLRLPIVAKYCTMFDSQLLDQISFGAALNEEQMALCGVVDSIGIVLLSAATSIRGHVLHWALRVRVCGPLSYLLCGCSVFAAHPYCGMMQSIAQQEKTPKNWLIVSWSSVAGIER